MSFLIEILTAAASIDLVRQMPRLTPLLRYALILHNAQVIESAARALNLEPPACDPVDTYADRLLNWLGTLYEDAQTETIDIGKPTEQ